MKYLLTAYWCAVVGVIVFYLIRALCAVYYKALQSTGETIMARDVVGLVILPYVLAALGIFLVIKLRHDK